jgi:hypothetical protein
VRVGHPGPNQPTVLSTWGRAPEARAWDTGRSQRHPPIELRLGCVAAISLRVWQNCQELLLQLADPADAQTAQQQIRGDQRDAATRHRGAWLFADQAVAHQQLDLAVAVGQPPRGDGVFNLDLSTRLPIDEAG